VGQSKSLFRFGDALFRLVDSDWKWMQEYVYVTAKYTIFCPNDRQCEFGSGIFSSGRPLGGRGKFNGFEDLRIYGAGSIHVRIADGKGPCFVGICEQSNFLVGVYGKPSIADAWLSLADAYEEWRRNRGAD
jgi:hypothetical protein